MRLRCKTAWMRLRSRVCYWTRALRRETSWRRRRVRSSGTQTGGMKSAAKSCARMPASTLSVFTLALAIALVRSGLETTTRLTLDSKSLTRAQVFELASITTSSAGRSCFANTRSSVGAVEMRSRLSSSPAYRIAISAKCL